MNTATRLCVAAIAVVTLALTGCAGSADPISSSSTEAATARSTESGTNVSVKIGSANFPESTLLAEIYAAALEAQGASVEKTLNIGNRDAYYKAMQDGSINLMPEYSGALLSFVDKDAAAVTAAEIYAALPAAVATDGLQVLEPSSAEDKDSLVVTQETATKYNLKTIADLAPVAGELTLGAAAEFETTTDGTAGLERLYGVRFGSFTALDAGGTLSLSALKNGQVDVTDLFTTDPSISSNGFVTLEDPKGNFRAQQILPLVNDSVAAATAPALNAVSAKLTTANLTEMLARVYSNEDPATVAEEWLTANGLI